MESDSRVGVGCLVRLMAVFAAHMHINAQTNFIVLLIGMLTTGEIHSVGVFSGTFSMISSCSSQFISYSTF